MTPELSDDLWYATLLAQENGASSWLTSLSILEHGHAILKGSFNDAFPLHCGWLSSGIPSECLYCKKFSVKHGLLCTRGGFLTLCHNEIHDLTASLLKEVC